MRALLVGTVLAWLFLGVVGLFLARQYLEAVDLRDHGRTAEGRVVSVVRKRSTKVTYEFHVGGKRYEGREDVGDQYAPGAVRVYYDPADPARNRTESYLGRNTGISSMGGIFWLLLGGPVLILTGYTVVVLRRRRNKGGG